MRGLKRKLDFEISKSKLQSKKQRITEEDFITFCKEKFSDAVTNFIITNLEMCKKRPKGFRYSNEYKQFALTIYFLSPQTYKFLRKTFCLPSISTLYTTNFNLDVCELFEFLGFSAKLTSTNEVT